MLSEEDADKLAANLDHFPVPMIAAERATKDDPFRMICLNAAHTRVSLMTNDAVGGALLTEVFPKDDARAVGKRFDDCVTTERILSYRETLMLGGRLTSWDTTLQPVRMCGTRQRVIALSLALSLPTDTSGFTDAEFLAAKAQMQLTQVSALLAMLRNDPTLPGDARTGAVMTTKLTRTVEQTLMDLRMSVRSPRPYQPTEKPTLRVVD